MTRTPPELEQLPARLRGLEVENVALRKLVENLQRANATYGAGWATWNRERNELVSQLELAMLWGAELADDVKELLVDVATSCCPENGQRGRHTADCPVLEGFEIIAKPADAMFDWLLAGREVAEQKGATAETLAELDALLEAYDAVRHRDPEEP